jgi:hypothetical protein
MQETHQRDAHWSDPVLEGRKPTAGNRYSPVDWIRGPGWR